MRNYEKLEGKIIDFITPGGNITKGKVIGCDFDIGVTVVKARDIDGFLVCLLGKMAPQWKEEGWGETKYDNKKFKLLFNVIAKQIETGIVEYEALKKAALMICNGEHINYHPSQEDCAFGQ